MRKKILPIFLLVAVCIAAFFSCKKVTISTADVTRNYFPLQLGKSVTYAVDSTYYYGPPGTEYHVSMYMNYAITDTVTINKMVWYMMNISNSAYATGPWVPSSVVLMTISSDSLLYRQNQVQYIKMVFPVSNGLTWLGNTYAETQDSSFAYFANWNYIYRNAGLSYFNGDVMFDHTVTVVEDSENVNYQDVDSLVPGHLTYAKEVYANNVGMIYREITHYTFGPPDTVGNKNGYSVVMRAVEY